MSSSEQQSVFGHLSKYWVIYAFVIQTVITWTLMGARITNLEIEQAKQQAKIDKTDIVLLDIQTRLASIETSLKYIAEDRRNKN